MSKIERLHIAGGQRGGGCEIRTREGLHPTRFPTMLTGVHQWPQPSVTCPNLTTAVAGERHRTGVNETQTETRPSATSYSRVTRFRGLRSPIHHRPRVYLTWAERRPAFAGELPRTGVNETKTEPRGSVRGPVGWPPVERHPGSAETISWALNPEQGKQAYGWPACGYLPRSATSARRRQRCLSAPGGSWPLPFRSQNRTPLRCAPYEPSGRHCVRVPGGGR